MVGLLSRNKKSEAHNHSPTHKHTDTHTPSKYITVFDASTTWIIRLVRFIVIIISCNNYY